MFLSDNIKKMLIFMNEIVQKEVFHGLSQELAQFFLLMLIYLFWDAGEG